MNRKLALALGIAALLALILGVTFFRSSGAASSAYLGYIEHETMLIAPPVAGRLVARSAERGAIVAADAVLFVLDPVQAQAERDQAAAARDAARAQLADLQTGRRSEERAVLAAQTREAEAALRLAERELERIAKLQADGTVSRAALDRATAVRNEARARLEQTRAQENVGALGGREAAIAAAEAHVRETEAALARAEARLSDLSPRAPVEARVDDVFFDPGEWVAAGQPVVALVAAANVKLRFFVPQAEIAQTAPGRLVAFRCDGCAGEGRARITRVAARAEYTPPVIYSETTRQKLVFLVEAVPLEPRDEYRAGLPVDVRLLPEGGS